MSCSLHDVQDLELRNVPSIHLCAEGFRGAAVIQMETLNLGEPHIAYVWHPFASLTADEIKKCAEAVVDEVDRKFRGMADVAEVAE